MRDFEAGDRVRIDDGDRHHGRHGRIDELDDGDDEPVAAVLLDTGDRVECPVSEVRPAAGTGIRLSEREADVLGNIWGDDVETDLRVVDLALLWEMKRRVAEAVRRSYDDDDMAAMGVLAPLEVKISQVLAERIA